VEKRIGLKEIAIFLLEITIFLKEITILNDLYN